MQFNRYLGLAFALSFGAAACSGSSTPADASRVDGRDGSVDGIIGAEDSALPDVVRMDSPRVDDVGVRDVPATGDANPCPGAQLQCSGRCTDTAVDHDHCGSCTTMCAAGQVCTQGTCQLTCGTGLSDCTGSCRDLQTDRANCGTCGAACSAGRVCSTGMCRVSCTPGLTECTGSCRDLQSDRANCGTCGNACNAGQVCDTGSCQLSCSTGLTACTGSCRDLQSDNRNCGTCGTVCAAGT